MIAGAVEGGRIKSSKETVGPVGLIGVFSARYLSLFITSTAVIILRVVLL
jgi:hypothetical protein